MNLKPMKILIIEDDVNDCNSFINCIKQRDDIELVAVTDSDIEGLKYVKIIYFYLTFNKCIIIYKH